ncbi:MAG: hypothetical protein QM718_09745 [Steroidobacteraceae bacterium]
MPALKVAARFCGPPGFGNGGYFCGLLAARGDAPLRVRLERPIPLETDLDVISEADGVLRVQQGEQVIARAAPADLELAVPMAPDYVQALAASRRYLGFAIQTFPNCFVCGINRARGDGLRVFAGALSDASGATLEMVAAPWLPDESLVQADGKVAAEYMWAALDCPGYFAARNDGVAMLLGEYQAQIDRRVHTDESCVIVGWRLAVNGRKYEAGTALFDEDGEPCGRARALWIEPRAGLPKA